MFWMGSNQSGYKDVMKSFLGHAILDDIRKQEGTYEKARR